MMTPLKATSLGYTPLHPTLSGSGYNLFIHENALGFLNEAIQDNYASMKLLKKIVAMRSNPRPWDGGIKRGATDHRQLAIDGIWVNYFIESGCVYINTIRINNKSKAKHELPGIHVVSRNENSWSITKRYVSEVKTEYAAVNGQNNSRDTAAANVMPPQLLNAYKDSDIKEYTLFHNPTVSVFADTYESARDKLGLTNPMTRKFSELLLKTQNKQHNVKWVTHSQGGAIFSEAVNYHNKKIGSPLDKHTVYFQASANNMMVTKRILKKAQVKLHNEGYNNSPIDGVPQVIGLNSITDTFSKPGIKSLGRLSLAPFALIPGLLPLAFMSAEFSTHTTPYEGLGKYGKKVIKSSSRTLKNMINKIT